MLVRKSAILASISPVMLLALSSQALANAPNPSIEAIKAKIHSSIKQGKPLKELYSNLGTEYGGSAIAPLIEIASDRKNGDETRWAALFGLARIAGRHSVGVIKKFMTDSSWMLRDAALKTAAAVNARELAGQIEGRLKDDALIVRTTAVETIGHLKMRESAPKLVDALFDPINFHNDKALWIHKHILDVLAGFKYDKGVPRLVELLEKTKDEKLRGDVVATLEKITGKRFADKPIADQVYLWKRAALSEMTF